MELTGRTDGKEPDDRRREKARALRDRLRAMTVEDLKEVYGSSDQVAATARTLLEDPGHYRALPAYAGMIFKELSYETLRPDQQHYLDDHLWILTALYGYLRPDERLTPYRLDLVDDLGLDLVAHWQEELRSALPEEGVVVNLASKEYMKLIDKRVLGDRLVTVDFKERRSDGKLRTVATYAKKARGAFLRFAAITKPTTVEELKHFDGLGYTYSEDHSKGRILTFLR
jgi:cytoplasmic iron level regulating protein YaaA (DUF328/UPF0246 family)